MLSVASSINNPRHNTEEYKPTSDPRIVQTRNTRAYDYEGSLLPRINVDSLRYVELYPVYHGELLRVPALPLVRLASHINVFDSVGQSVEEHIRSREVNEVFLWKRLVMFLLELLQVFFGIELLPHWPDANPGQ